jgi:hypothetical protein
LPRTWECFATKDSTLVCAVQRKFFKKQIYFELVIQDIPNCKNINDDIIVFGFDNEEHDKALHKVLKRLEESVFTLNVEKCALRQKELDFSGFISHQKA